MNRKFLPSISEYRGQGLLSILGPTGSGKTGAALAWIRENFPTQLKTPLLISLDSVAVYKGLDIGSAKVMGRDRHDFDWFGLDLIEPSEKITAQDFSKLVEVEILKATLAERPILLVGGSHFYEKVIVEGPGPGLASDQSYIEKLEEFPNSILFDRLKVLDPRWGDKVHENDRYRLKRYLDLTDRQGLSLDEIFGSQAVAQTRSRPWGETHCVILGLDTDVEDSDTRLKYRIDAMLDQGWLDEIKSLLQKYPATAPAFQSIGYKELLPVVQGKMRLDVAWAEIYLAHRQLAKAQRTWLRGLLKRYTK